MEAGEERCPEAAAAEAAERVAGAAAEAAAALAGEPTLEVAFAVMVDQVARLLGARIVFVHAFAEDARELRLRAARGAGPEIEALVRALPILAPALAARAAGARQVQDAAAGDAASAELLDLRAMSAAGGRWAIAAPLVVAERLLGVISCALDAPSVSAAEDAAVLRALAVIFGAAQAAASAREQAARDFEELRRARDALGEAEERLNRTLEDAPIGMAVVGLDGRFVRVNRALCRIVGYEREELERIRFQDITHPDDLTPNLLQIERLLRGEIDAYQLAKRYVRRDRVVIDAMLSGSLVRDASGNPLHFIAQVVDVTAQRRIEEALLTSERQFRAVFDHAVDAIIIADDLGRVADANPAACAMLRAARESVIGEELFSFVEDPGWARETWRRFLEQGVFQSEMTVHLRDGRILTVEVSARAHFLPGRHLAILRDVAARRRAKEEREQLLAQLAAERRWLRSVIEGSPVGIVLVEGPEGQRIAANRRMEELLGIPLSPEGGIAQYMSLTCDPGGQVLPPEDSPAARALGGEVIQGRELLLCPRGGREVPVLVSAGPIRDDQGRIVGAAVMYEDISALRALERLREEWTSVVTHELRQPVATIHGYAGVLARELKDQERAWAKHIQASARRLDRMISDLHEASQIDTRRLAIELTPTDLAALVAAAVERAGAEAEGRPIRVDIRGEIPVTEVDPARIEQVLGNLLSNAVKYGDPGTSIRVGVARRDAEVEVEVESRGPGIAADDLPRLFGRFQRARPPGGKRVPGTGLGLYICRGIVEAHGGRIWAESVPGGVTTFRFTLPVR